MSSEYEFGMLASLDAGLDEFHKPDHVMVEAMVVEKLLDAAQLLDRHGKGRRWLLKRGGARPVEVAVGVLIIAWRQDVVRAWAQMPIALQEPFAWHRSDVAPD